MRIGVMIEGQRVARWQAEALRSLTGQYELLVYNCVNPEPAPRRWRNGLYYLLNLFTVRNRLTRSVPLASAGLNIAAGCEYEGEADGRWQKLPAWLLDRLRADRLDVLVKFNSALLRIPEPQVLPTPILSYHHGDPRKFRGRPAGFYELCTGTPVMGQIVQILSNRLDAGKVVAYAETKVHRHSYRATLVEAYRHSPLLLRHAIEHARSGTALPIEPAGKVYKLPGNGTVAAFVARRLTTAFGRVLYGLFIEKKWNVSRAALSPERYMTGAEDGTIDASGWQSVPVPGGYSFLADPFFNPAGEGLLVEALNAKTGLGEILTIDGNRTRKISSGRRHYSYPASVEWQGCHYLIPEISEWSDPRIYTLGEGGLHDVGALQLSEGGALLDPTLLVKDGRVYLFANRANEGSGVLRLWLAPGLFESFVEHPMSPIRISPEGSRMGGAIVSASGRLRRLGQDGRERYGDGLVGFDIEALDPAVYAEAPAAALRFSHVAGPHTLNFSTGEAVFDWYVERFSLGAGLRRILGRLRSR
jgi:hypothetical protein